MPYIADDAKTLYRRTSLRNHTLEDFALSPLTPGEITFIVCDLLWEQWNWNQTFAGAASLIGAINAAVMEFYRRKVAPYEDTKIAENGDL